MPLNASVFLLHRGVYTLPCVSDHELYEHALATPSKHHRVSIATQTYLRAILTEGQTHAHVSLGRMAQRLGVSTPAISRKAKSLVRSGHIRRDGACGLVLTERGRPIALHALRKQEIVETFLVQQLHYGWDEVYALALDMSLHLDDALIERMYDQLGQPAFCPHGNPIPTRAGVLKSPITQTLSSLAVHSQATISSIASHEPELLRYLASIALVPGATVLMKQRTPFGGPLHVQLVEQSKEILLGLEAAEQVRVSVPTARG